MVHKSCYETRISIPSLHVWGESDEIIPEEMSQMVESNFEYAKKVTHSGGHYFPATANEKQIYIEFFQDQLQRHLEDRELENGVIIDNGETGDIES